MLQRKRLLKWTPLVKRSHYNIMTVVHNPTIEYCVDKIMRRTLVMDVFYPPLDTGRNWTKIARPSSRPFSTHLHFGPHTIQESWMLFPVILIVFSTTVCGFVRSIARDIHTNIHPRFCFRHLGSTQFSIFLLSPSSDDKNGCQTYMLSCIYCWHSGFRRSSLWQNIWKAVYLIN